MPPFSMLIGPPAGHAICEPGNIVSFAPRAGGARAQTPTYASQGTPAGRTRQRCQPTDTARRQERHERHGVTRDAVNTRSRNPNHYLILPGGRGCVFSGRESLGRPHSTSSCGDEESRPQNPHNAHYIGIASAAPFSSAAGGATSCGSQGSRCCTLAPAPSMLVLSARSDQCC
jgi:hypothetical protein